MKNMDCLEIGLAYGYDLTENICTLEHYKSNFKGKEHYIMAYLKALLSNAGPEAFIDFFMCQPFNFKQKIYYYFDILGDWSNTDGILMSEGFYHDKSFNALAYRKIFSDKFGISVFEFKLDEYQNNTNLDFIRFLVYNYRLDKNAVKSFSEKEFMSDNLFDFAENKRYLYEAINLEKIC